MVSVELSCGRTSLGVRVIVKVPALYLDKIKESVEDGSLEDLVLDRRRERCWTYPIERYYQVLEGLESSTEPRWNILPVPTALLNFFMYRYQQIQKKPVELPASLTDLPVYQRLYPYQKQGVRFIVENQGRGILGDDMGLGKSIQAVTLVRFYGVRTLIIAPSSVKQHWVNEFRAHGMQLENLTNQKETVSQWVIVSYSLLSRRTDPSVFEGYSMVVLDEAHYVKCRQSKRTKMITRLLSSVPKILLLTGTPITRPIDLYSIFKLLHPVLFKRFHRWPKPGQETKTQEPAKEFFYADRYCAPQQKQISRYSVCTDFNGTSRLLELNLLLSFFMIRRLKKDVLCELPAKTRQVVALDTLQPEDRAYFSRAIGDLADITNTDGKMLANARLIELVTCTARLKLEALKTYVQKACEELREGDKVLLFAHHHSVLDTIHTFLTEKGVDCITIDGRTPTKERQKKVDAFQNGETPRVALLGIQAAGTGLNLFRANRVVFLELVWNSKDILQCEDRAHRIGQTRPVTVQYLVLQGSTDDMVIRSLQTKFYISNFVTDLVSKPIVLQPSKRQKTIP